MRKSTPDPLKLVLIGPPGCGKGTQAMRLKEKFSLAHVSSGDVLRSEVARGTSFGKQVESFMAKGEIGPAELITDIILHHLDSECTHGFILDGFPRTLYQAEALTERHRIDAAFFISVPEDEIVQRITGRRICRKCGAIYHISSHPPEKEGICDDCGGELYQRDDDTSKTVKNRLRVYSEETAPVVSFYEEKGLLHRVEGGRPPEEVFVEIQSIIDRV